MGSKSAVVMMAVVTGVVCPGAYWEVWENKDREQTAEVVDVHTAYTRLFIHFPNIAGINSKLFVHVLPMVWTVSVRSLY